MSTRDPGDPYAPPPDSGRRPPPRDPRRRVFPTPSDHPATRAGKTALLVGIAGVGMTLVLFPVGLVLDATAVYLGLRARKRAREAGVHAQGAVGAIVLGLSSAVLLICVLGLLGPQLSRYAECLSGANTEIAKQNCRNAWMRDVERRFGVRIQQTLLTGGGAAANRHADSASAPPPA